MGQVFGRTGVAEPAYDVLYKHNERLTYEVRRYGVRYVAETTYEGSDDNPFMVLARYIGVFGTPENEGKEKIAMTAPVVKETKPTAIAMTAPVVRSENKEGQKTMDFFLPAEYDSLSKIPKPTNPHVHIKEIQGAVGAVHRYSGSMQDDKAHEMAKELAQQLEKDGVDVMEDYVMEHYQFWGYNPPFTLPMFRRNEIWVELDEKQVDSLVNGPGMSAREAN